MTCEEEHQLALQIARAIFACGDAPNDPAQRIEFKGGTWPNHETSHCGLCESALAEVIRKVPLLIQTERDAARYRGIRKSSAEAMDFYGTDSEFDAMVDRWNQDAFVDWR